jgi:hypothetical protein
VPPSPLPTGERDGVRGLNKMLKKLEYVCSSDYLKYRGSMLELHKINTGRVSEKLYDSLYLGDPYGKPLLGLCFDGGKLVGQENYIRQDVTSNGAIRSGALGINTIVDSNYRLFYGVFKELIRMTMDRLKENTDILCAFANEESKQYYIKYFDWKISSKVQVYKKSIGYSGLSAESFLAMLKPGKLSKDFILTEFKRFDPKILNEILTDHKKTAKYSYFFKSCEFLNWKFLDNKHYHTAGYLIQDKGATRGYIVTLDDGIETKIVDFLIDNDDVGVFEKAISSLAYIASRKGKKRLVIYATPNCWYLNALQRQMFIYRWEFDFITVLLNKGSISPDWVIQIGDFDIF